MAGLMLWRVLDVLVNSLLITLWKVFIHVSFDHLLLYTPNWNLPTLKSSLAAWPLAPLAVPLVVAAGVIMRD